MSIRRREFLAGAAASAAWPAVAAEPSLDIAYVNGRIWTGSRLIPRSDAMGTVGDRIGAIGAASVRARSGPRTRIVIG